MTQARAVNSRAAITAPPRGGKYSAAAGRRGRAEALSPDATVSLADERRAADVKDVFTALDRQLVGLVQVKKKVEEVASLLLVDRVRQRFGLQAPRPNLHMCFTGDPGTGKTTVALQMAILLLRQVAAPVSRRPLRPPRRRRHLPERWPGPRPGRPGTPAAGLVRALGNPRGPEDQGEDHRDHQVEDDRGQPDVEGVAEDRCPPTRPSARWWASPRCTRRSCRRPCPAAQPASSAQRWNHRVNRPPPWPGRSAGSRCRRAAAG